MSEPNWLGKETIQAIHSLSLSRFGGDDGLRDAHALESALVRPLQHFRFSSPAPSLFELAVLYGSGLVKSHPFIDGNKRTGFIAAYTFLGINGYALTASEEDAAIRIHALADCRLSVEELATWLEENCAKKA